VVHSTRPCHCPLKHLYSSRLRKSRCLWHSYNGTLLQCATPASSIDWSIVHAARAVLALMQSSEMQSSLYLHHALGTMFNYVIAFGIYHCDLSLFQSCSAAPNALMQDGSTVLRMAVLSGSVAVAQLLLDKGAPVDDINEVCTNIIKANALSWCIKVCIAHATNTYALVCISPDSKM
jgi:hypothetical protein